MPRYELISGPRIRVMANRFLIGHPYPSGSRPLTATEALMWCGRDKRKALFMMSRLCAIPTIDARGNHVLQIMEPGDWLVRLENGNMHAVTDEQFHRQFRLIEPPEGKR